MTQTLNACYLPFYFWLKVTPAIPDLNTLIPRILSGILEIRWNRSSAPASVCKKASWWMHLFVPALAERHTEDITSHWTPWFLGRCFLFGMIMRTLLHLSLAKWEPSAGNMELFREKALIGFFFSYTQPFQKGWGVRKWNNVVKKRLINTVTETQILPIWKGTEEQWNIKEISNRFLLHFSKYIHYADKLETCFMFQLFRVFKKKWKDLDSKDRLEKLDSGLFESF